MTDIGPHLLGRKYKELDPRAFTMDMVYNASPLEISFQQLLAAKGANPKVKAWAAEVMKVLEPSTPPPPPPPPDSKVWELNTGVLDQEDTPHCGGFGGCQWSNVAPVENTYQNSDGHALYYEIKVLEGDPGAENGVYSEDVPKALKARKRLNSYAFAKNVDEIKTWLLTKGPVMMGTDWTYDMFDTDSNGFVSVTGSTAGGHFWVLRGYVSDGDYFEAVNSWGESWGKKGTFKLHPKGLATLLSGVDYPGDAILSPELAL